MNLLRPAVHLFLWSLAAVSLRAEAVKDREGAVRGDRAKLADDARWIYNDVDKGFETARAQGKPLLVVLRCVPCLACMGMDAGVLSDGSLAPLLDRFVCVRLIHVNSLDLAKFQFDFDLSFSTMFFGPDGTVLGRYGSWQHQKNAEDTSLEGFTAAMEAVLRLHAAGKSAALGPKHGGKVPFRTPVEMPDLAKRYRRELDWDGKVVASCVHCHQIGDALRAWHREAGRAMPEELIYPMPMPETAGLTLDGSTCATVKAVAAGSAAAAAGIAAGDVLEAADGAPLISEADLSWALHRVPAAGRIRLTVRRGGKSSERVLELKDGWRRQADISRRVGTWQMRAMALGGLKLERVSDERRRAAGLAPGTMALEATGVGEYGAHAASKRAGFQKGDILTAVGEWQDDLTESGLIGRILTNQPRPCRLRATVRRGGQTVTLELPVQ